MKLIPLNGFRNHKEAIIGYAIVDDDDYCRLAQYNWCKSGNYARRSYKENGKTIYISMHKEIMGYTKEMVDHKNRNTLDNRKENLRLCTAIQNSRNKLRKPTAISRFHGVTYCKWHKKWKAQIMVDGKRPWVAYYSDEEDAARARDEKSKEYFGEYAALNFPD